MNNAKEVLKDLLRPNSSDFYLKRYFKEMEDVYGIDVAVETALEKKEIKDSINFYRPTDAKINDLDIDLAILKSAVLTNNVNNEYYLTFAKKMIYSGKTEALINLMNSNTFLKRDLVKKFAESSSYSYSEQFKKVKNQRMAFGMLATLSYYKVEKEMEQVPLLKRYL